MTVGFAKREYIRLLIGSLKTAPTASVESYTYVVLWTMGTTRGSAFLGV
jgi:hypothetical protein